MFDPDDYSAADDIGDDDDAPPPFDSAEAGAAEDAPDTDASEIDPPDWSSADQDAPDATPDPAAAPFPYGVLGGWDAPDPTATAAPADPWAIPEVGILNPDAEAQLQAYQDRMGALQDALGRMYPMTNGPVDDTDDATAAILKDPWAQVVMGPPYDDSAYAPPSPAPAYPFQPGVVVDDGTLIPDGAGLPLGPATSSTSPGLVTPAVWSVDPNATAPKMDLLSAKASVPIGTAAYLPDQDKPFAGGASDWAHPNSPLANAPSPPPGISSSYLQKWAATTLQSVDPNANPSLADALKTLADGNPLRPDQMAKAEVRTWLAAVPPPQTVIHAIPGAPETGADAWRAENDQVFLDAVNDFNAEHHLTNGDPGYWTADMLKAQAMRESRGKRAAFESDPLQVNVPGDWNPDKLKYTDLADAHQQMTPALSARAALQWLYYKGRPIAGSKAGVFRGYFNTLQRYNASRSDVDVANNAPGGTDYATQITSWTNQADPSHRTN